MRPEAAQMVVMEVRVATCGWSLAISDPLLQLFVIIHTRGRLMASVEGASPSAERTVKTCTWRFR
jgi:hypothetical protein